MNNSLSKAIKEAYAVAPATEVIIETLELSHPKLEETLYIVKQREGITATLENGESVYFEPVGFTFSLPAAGENGRQDMQISIDNVDRRISDFIDKAKLFFSPVKVVFRPYLNTDLTAPQMNPPLVLALQDVSVTTQVVAARATFADILNQKFPKEYYLRSRFPSLGY